MKRFISTALALIAILALLTSCYENSNSTTNKQITAQTIVLSQNTITLTEGESITLTYTVLPNNAQYYLIWNSLNQSVATVNNGIITAVGVGQTNIVISDSNGASAVCNVTVKQKSAYDRLSSDERDFVDTFLKAINSFKNPSSVYIEEILYTTSKDSWDILGKWQVYLAAQNGFGGNSTGLYCLSQNGSISKALLQWEPIGDSKYDINKINDAIQEKIQ